MCQWYRFHFYLFLFLWGTIYGDWFCFSPTFGSQAFFIFAIVSKFILKYHYGDVSHQFKHFRLFFLFLKTYSNEGWLSPHLLYVLIWRLPTPLLFYPPLPSLLYILLKCCLLHCPTCVYPVYFIICCRLVISNLCFPLKLIYFVLFQFGWWGRGENKMNPLEIEAKIQEK